ncbi:MAG TPA: TolC family protein [Polyangia bacterium]|jgi:cobalt-zinc-cadmium efflux system outer membrane protein|nr:TolC family protein [Polyangia bacterium]
MLGYATVLLTAAALGAEPTPAPHVPDALRLASEPSDQELAWLLWHRSPDLEAARVRIGTAAAEVERSLLLPNPQAEFNWGTIPVGPTNPAGLDSPLSQIPNYSIALSTLVEIGKRGPRQEAARHNAQATVLDAIEQLRQRHLDLLGLLGEIAATEIRIATLSALAADAQRITAIQQRRADKGDVAQLDSDRAALEEQKLLSNLREQQSHLLEQLRFCADLTGVPCEPFGEGERANAFLERPWPGVPGQAAGDTTPPLPLEERPDLQSLREQERAAQAALRLAHARAIPDPTLRAGYLHDRFVISGNQRNSLFVGVSLPLTLFDRGQADARAAEATARGASRIRTLLLERAEHELERCTEQSQALTENRTRLRSTTLPLARSVVARLEQAVAQGGAPLQELLLARRTLGELLIDATELDLATFRLSLARARLGGGGPHALPVTSPPLPR